jgi:hypothetical protein
MLGNEEHSFFLVFFFGRRAESAKSSHSQMFRRFWEKEAEKGTPGSTLAEMGLGLAIYRLI